MPTFQTDIAVPAHISARPPFAPRRSKRILYGVCCNQDYRCCFDVEFSTARTSHHEGSHPSAIAHETFNLTTEIEYHMGVLGSGAQWRVYVCVVEGEGRGDRYWSWLPKV